MKTTTCQGHVVILFCIDTKLIAKQNRKLQFIDKLSDVTLTIEAANFESDNVFVLVL